MRAALPAALLLLAACGGAAGSSATDSSATETTPEAPLPRQPCPLAEDLELAVPIAPEHALAAAPGGCMLVDERAEARFVALSALAADAVGSELVRDDPARFFEASGLLGADARRTGTAELRLLGRAVPAQRWAASPEGLGPRALLTAARRIDAHWLLVMIVTAPGDGGEDLQRLTESLTTTP